MNVWYHIKQISFFYVRTHILCGCYDSDTKNIIVNTWTVCILEKQTFNGIGNFLPFDKCAEHEQFLLKLDNFVPCGRLPFGKVVIQIMTEFVVSNNQIPGQQYQK